jgi:hypothetical protein
MNKKLYSFFSLLLIAAFFFGRFSAPESIKTDDKKQEIKSVDTESDKSKDKIKTTTVIEKKDGTKVTRTKVEYKTIVQTVTIKEDAKTEEHKEEIKNRSGVTVSALAGIPLNASITKGPVYGVSVSKPFLGPIALGAFAFTDMRVGVSIGLEL